MSVVNPIEHSHLMDDPALRVMFKSAESRHLSSDELQQYVDAAPQYKNRAKAAIEVAAAEANVIKMTVMDILAMYPFEKNHSGALQKCIRDETYVSVYATHAMLMNDNDWLRDKLLLWMGTIVKAFEFPVREEPEQQSKEYKTAFDRYPDITKHADTLSPGNRALYDTYARLLRNYSNLLSPESFALMEAPLQLCLDILSSE